MDDWGMNGQVSGFIGREPPGASQSSEEAQSATYLPEEEGEPLHSCEEILDKIFSSWPNFTDTAISNADLELCTDGSWSLQEGGYWSR
jgi:hypothetical protein